VTTTADNHATRAFNIWRALAPAERKCVKLGILPYGHLIQAMGEGFDVDQITVELIYFSIESEKKRA
jgi:hypothetical protein